VEDLLMSRYVIASLMLTSLAAAAIGCGGSSSTTPTPVNPILTGTMNQANEVPAISNADGTGTGTVTITMHVTKDSAGNITAATGDFSVTLSGFPAGTSLTGAHIHPGAAGTSGGILVSTGLTAGEVTLANGSGSFTKNGVAFSDPAVAQQILNSPASYYFNVHTTLSPGGAIRTQLLRTQ
jgi:hypothetical protein